MNVKLKITQYADVEVTKESLNEMIDAYLENNLDKDCYYSTKIEDNELKMSKSRPDKSSYSYYNDCYKRWDEVLPTESESALASLLYYKQNRFKK